MRRSGKFYRNNEKDIMEELGFENTPNSGSGWIIKEDGQNENCICQLKSTDAKSIKINIDDLHTLQYNALVSHKLPIFVIQFLQTNELFILVTPQQMQDIVKYIKTGNISNMQSIVDINDNYVKYSNNVKNKIKSTSNAKQNFMEELESKYRKDRSAT